MSARAPTRIVITLCTWTILFASVILGDARPGWCPFSEPSPGAGIRLPLSISPPATAPPSPMPAVYAVFDRPRVVEKGTRGQHAGPGPALMPASSRANAVTEPTSETEPQTNDWMGNPLWTTSACLLLALIGLLPVLWMRYAARSSTLPVDLAPGTWRGWTARPGGRRL